VVHMYPDVSFSQESFDVMKAKDDAHKVAMEEMKAKEDNANKEHETVCKKLEDDLNVMRRTKVVVYFIRSVCVC
jgi:hypothetical protein